jgi:hypothetical protein
MAKRSDILRENVVIKVKSGSAHVSVSGHLPVRSLLLSRRPHTHLLRRVGYGKNGNRCSMVNQLGKQFASHQPFLETGGTQACEQVEIVEVGDLADEGVQVTCKGHPTGPGTSDGKVLEKREEFMRMRMVGLDAVPLRSFGNVQLSVAADDDLTIAGLPPVEVAGEPLSLVMSEFERRLLVAVGMGVPVEVGLECTDAVKDP